MMGEEGRTGAVADRHAPGEREGGRYIPATSGPRLWLHNVVMWLAVPGLTILTWCGCWLTVPFASRSKEMHFRHGARRWGHWVCRWLGVRIRIKGAEHFEAWARSGGALIVSNHQSALDIPIILSVCPVIFAFVSKIEVFFIPFLGWFIWTAGMVAVRRGHRSSAARALDATSEAIARGERILMFPEGTRSEDGELIPFKRGIGVVAAKTRAPILPMAVHGSIKLLPPHKLWGRSGDVTISFGAPLSLEDVGSADGDAKAIAENIRDRINGLMTIARNDTIPAIAYEPVDARG